jgi:hypothetical protein
MEPVRPVADELVLDLLDAHELSRTDVFENREGVCRIGPPMARRLAQLGRTPSSLPAHCFEPRVRLRR